MKMLMEKKNYVESLNEMLAPMQDFESIKYATTSTGGEYIRIADIIGGCAFLDVTGDSLEQTLEKVAQIILHKVPGGVVKDIESKRKIARLFR